MKQYSCMHPSDVKAKPSRKETGPYAWTFVVGFEFSHMHATTLVAHPNGNNGVNLLIYQGTTTFKPYIHLLSQT